MRCSRWFWHEDRLTFTFPGFLHWGRVDCCFCRSAQQEQNIFQSLCFGFFCCRDRIWQRPRRSRLKANCHVRVRRWGEYYTELDTKEQQRIFNWITMWTFRARAPAALGHLSMKDCLNVLVEATCVGEHGCNTGPWCLSVTWDEFSSCWNSNWDEKPCTSDPECVLSSPLKHEANMGGWKSSLTYFSDPTHPSTQ